LSEGVEFGEGLVEFDLVEGEFVEELGLIVGDVINDSKKDAKIEGGGEDKFRHYEAPGDLSGFLAVGAPGTEAAAWLNGGDDVPKAAIRATALAGGRERGYFLLDGGHLAGHRVGIELLATETALDCFQFDGLGAGGALFFRIEPERRGSKGRRWLSCGQGGVVTTDITPLGVKRQGQEPQAASDEDGKKGAEA
jgi:hypothetical protein